MSINLPDLEPGDEGYNPILDDDGVGEGYDRDENEIVSKPNQEFDWEYEDNEDDEDEAAEEGVQPDGSYISYSRTFYSFPSLNIGAYRFRMSITNHPTFPDRTIDRYLTGEEVRKYTASGQGSDRDLFEFGELQEDMEYFLTRLQAAERNYDDVYVSPVT